jgi:hypothetical protein
MHQSHSDRGKEQDNNLSDNSDEQYWKTYPQCKI